MSGRPPKPIKAPYEQTNRFAPQSIAGTPEAQAFLDVPIDTDPGVGRRTDLEEQEVGQRWDSAFMAGVPAWIRERNRESEMRGVRSRGAAEAQQANYQKNLLELERRRSLLPQVAQTGSSGFNTQIQPAQPGLGSSILGGAARIGAAAIPFI